MPYDNIFPKADKCPLAQLANMLAHIFASQDELTRILKTIEEQFVCEKCIWYRRIPFRVSDPFRDDTLIDTTVYDCSIAWQFYINAETSRASTGTKSAVEDFRNKAMEGMEAQLGAALRMVSIFQTALSVQEETERQLSKPNGGDKPPMLEEEH